MRETASETLLCLATRGPHEGLRLDAHALGASEGARLGNVYGGASDLEVGGGAVSLPGGGPSFQVWKVR